MACCSVPERDTPSLAGRSPFCWLSRPRPLSGGELEHDVGSACLEVVGVEVMDHCYLLSATVAEAVAVDGAGNAAVAAHGVEVLTYFGPVDH